MMPRGRAEAKGSPMFYGPESRLRAIIESEMAAQKSMLSEFPWDPRYRVSSIEELLTPALALYPEILISNVERTLDLLGGDPNRLRVHIKTAKMSYTLSILLER